MEPSYLTVGESLEFLTVSVQTIVLLLTAEMTLVFGYSIAVYSVLRTSPVLFRLGAFVSISLLMVFFWLSISYQMEVFQGFVDQRQLSVDAGVIIDLTENSSARMREGIRLLAMIINVINASVLFGLFYFSFLMKPAKSKAAT